MKDCSGDKIQQLYSWLKNNQLVFLPKLGDTQNVVIPLCLTPATITIEQWQDLERMQKIWSRLIFILVKEREFLDAIALNLINVGDDFVQNLYRGWKRTRELEHRPRIHLDVLRSDYFIDIRNNQAKQVEINTISVSFAHHSALLSHCPYYYHNESTFHIMEHDASQRIADTFLEAINCFEQIYSVNQALAIMVVAADERNFYDQIGIIKAMKGRMNRLTFEETSQKIVIKKDGLAWFGEKPVALAYFRTGYSPHDYQSDGAWEIRTALEESHVICVPTFAAHLAGLKKVQQELAHPNRLEQFMKDSAEINLLRSSFVRFIDLTNPSEFEEIKRNPTEWVLKPQREGGGHLVTDEDILTILKSPSRSHYIAMEKISPSIDQSRILKSDGTVVNAQVVHELGTFGVFLSVDDRVVRNEVVGVLVRSKESHVKEGGVAAGFAALNNLWLDTKSMVNGYYGNSFKSSDILQ